MNEILSQVTPFLDLDSHSSFNAQQSLPCSSECPFSARDFYGPAYKFCFPQRTPSQSNPQPQVSPVVQSVLDAKSELDIWKALGARTKAILRAKKASPNLSEYEGPLTAWRFQEVVSHPISLALSQGSPVHQLMGAESLCRGLLQVSNECRDPEMSILCFWLRLHDRQPTILSSLLLDQRARQ